MDLRSSLGVQAPHLASLACIESEFKAYVLQKMDSDPCLRDAIIPTIEMVLKQIREKNCEPLPASPCAEVFIELLDKIESELEVTKARLQQKERELDDMKNRVVDHEATGGSAPSVAARLSERGFVRAQTQQATNGGRNGEGPGSEKKEVGPLAIHEEQQGEKQAEEQAESGMVTDSDSEPAKSYTEEQFGSLMTMELEVEAYVLHEMDSNPPRLREAIIPTIENVLKQLCIETKESELEVAKARLEQKTNELEDMKKYATGPKASGSSGSGIAARLRERGSVRARAQQAVKFSPS